MTITKDSSVLVASNANHPLVQMGLIPMNVVEGKAITEWETSEQVLERLRRDAPEEIERHPGETPLPSVLVNAMDENGVIRTYICADLGITRSVQHIQDAPLVALIEKFDVEDPRWETKIPDELPEDFK